MSTGCLTELTLFQAFRAELPAEEAEKAFRHILDCLLCYEQWKRFVAEEQVAAAIRSAVEGDAAGADRVPGLEQCAPLPDCLEIPGFRIDPGPIEGGQARVYRGIHEASGEEVAIKVFRESALNQAGQSRFTRELRSLTRLRHPHVMPIRSTGEIQGHAYFVMPWIDGMTLDEYLARHSLSTVRKVQMMAKICSALAHAHNRGVMHLDLKPSNVRVEKSGHPWVLDFGLARLAGGDLLDAAGLTFSAAGTPRYMAPEQTGDEALLDVTADVYSLGLIMYEVLAERRARRPEVEGAGLTGRELARLQPLPLRAVAPQVGAELAAIVDMATAPDRRDRYQTAERMLEDLQRFLASEPVEAMQGYPFYWLGKAVRKHLAVIIAVAAVMFATLAWFYLRYDADQQVAERSEAITTLVDELVSKRLKGMTERLDRQNEDLKQVHLELAEAYSWVGEWQKAEEHRSTAEKLGSPRYWEEFLRSEPGPESSPAPAADARAGSEVGR